MRAIDLITDALEEAGIKDYASPVDGDTLNRGLKVLNRLIDHLSLDDVVIPYTQEIVQVLTGNPITIGVGGTVNVSRPREILNTSYILVNGIKYDLELVQQDVYNKMSPAAVNSTWPCYLYYEKSMPLGKLYFYPACTGDEIHLRINSSLPAFADYSTDYEIAQGYEAMLVYNLASWLCVGIKDTPPKIEQMAASTIRKLKTSNITVGTVEMPYILRPRRSV